VFRIFFIIFAAFQLSACGQENKSVLNEKFASQKLVSSCLTTQSQCVISTKLGEFEVKFSQIQSNSLKNKKAEHDFKEPLKQIKTELPFSMTVSLSKAENLNTEIHSVSGHLEGKDMFMGKVPVFFTKDDQGDNFTANSLLASCSEDVMVWRLWLTAQLTNKQKSEQQFFIDFESLRL
jgi:hypothetical protein